jgi:hypothetical protein
VAVNCSYRCGEKEPEPHEHTAHPFASKCAKTLLKFGATREEKEGVETPPLVLIQ